MTGAIGWLVARELRRRRRAVVVVALLVGLSGGVVLATAAGARRTASAYDRFVGETATRDASVQIDDGDVDASLAEIEDLEVVAASGRLEIIPVLPTDEALRNDIDPALYVSPDGRWGVDVDRPLVVHGRMPDPSSAGEVLLNELAAEETGLTVGDRLEVASFTPDQLEALHSGGTFDGFGGPVVELRVVGIGRQATDLQGADINAGSVLLAGPATHRSLDGTVGALGGLLAVDLRPGATVEELRAEVRRVVGPTASFDVTSADADFGRSTREAAEVLARSLAAFAAVAAVAGAVAVGGTIARQCAATQSETRTLGALGCDRRQRSVVAAAAPVAGLVLGTILAIATAVAASGRFPFSVARRVEPEPGIHVDGLVLGAGAIVLLGSGILWSAVTVRRLARTRPHPAGRRSWTSLALPPSASIGIGHTFERRTADRTVPVRSALAASALGVLGIVAAATVVHSFGALVDDPHRYGWAWSAEPDLYTDDPDALAAELAASPGVEAVATRHTARLELDGAVVPGFAFEPHASGIAPPLRQGRLPAATDEVVIGQRTADELGAGVGDRLAAGTASGDATVEVEVVGVGVFAPVETIDPATGALVTPEGLELLRRSDGYSSLLVRYRPGFDADALETSLMERDVADFSAVYARPRLPGALENLDRVMPIVVGLGAFFALLAVAGLAHALVVGTRRRHRELATLRALGMRRSQVRAIVTVTGLATVAFGIAVGIPLGLAVGRSAWAVIIGGQGLLDSPSVPTVVLLAVVPAGLALALVVSWWPGTAATRRPSTVLRAE